VLGLDGHERISQSPWRSRRVWSRSMIPRRARSVGDGPGRWRGIRRCPRRRTSPSGLLRCAHTMGLDGSTVERELALRPRFSALARMPPTARFALRGERRGLLVLTAGPVPRFYGRYPTGPVASSRSD
jgi:hypothetical protein